MSLQSMEVSNANQSGKQSRYQKRTWILSGLALFFGLVAIILSIAALAKVFEVSDHVNNNAVHGSLTTGGTLTGLSTGMQKLTADISVITTNLNNIMNENNLIKEKHRIDLLAIQSQTSQLILDLGNVSAYSRSNNARIVTTEQQLQSQITQNQVQFATINTGLNQTQNRLVSIENQVQSNNAVTNLKNELMVAAEFAWLTPFNGYQYRLTTTARPYDDCRTECQGYGGDLAVAGMKNLTMRGYIASTLFASLSILHEPWIGLNDISTEGEWRWIDGSLAAGNEINWFQTEPNGGRTENCAVSPGEPPRNYRSIDISCSSSKHGLCERKLGF